MRVLLVEDHGKTARLIARGLREHGYAVDPVTTGADAVWLGCEHTYDVVVLDVMLPDTDGFDVVRQLRAADRWAPVLMLTARGSVADRVRGLDMGADDYLVKPFAFDELLARLRSLTRREAVVRPTVVCVGDLMLDPATHQASRAGVLIALTPREFAVLHLLARNAGQTVSRQALLSHVWDFAFEGDPNVLDVYVRRLREKIDRPFDVETIRTVRGVGYALSPGGTRAPVD